MSSRKSAVPSREVAIKGPYVFLSGLPPKPTATLRLFNHLFHPTITTAERLFFHGTQVTVKYEVAGIPQGAEPLTMRKFYRFSVMNPVSMAAKCTAVRGRPFVEMQLRNTTQVLLLSLPMVALNSATHRKDSRRSFCAEFINLRSTQLSKSVRYMP